MSQQGPQGSSSSFSSCYFSEYHFICTSKWNNIWNYWTCGLFLKMNTRISSSHTALQSWFNIRQGHQHPDLVLGFRVLVPGIRLGLICQMQVRAQSEGGVPLHAHLCQCVLSKVGKLVNNSPPPVTFHWSTDTFLPLHQPTEPHFGVPSCPLALLQEQQIACPRNQPLLWRPTRPNSFTGSSPENGI